MILMPWLISMAEAEEYKTYTELLFCTIVIYSFINYLLCFKYFVLELIYKNIIVYY